MNTVTYLIPDTITMLQRILLHMRRHPVVTLLTILATPIILLLLMYNVFGGVVQLDGATASSTSYLNYLTPGIILITAIYGTGSAALRINSDMTQGIIARFKSMSISGSAVLNGHVIGSAIGTLASIMVIVGISYLMGFRPPANAAWLAAIGLILLYVLAVMWLAVAVGVSSKSPEGVNTALYLFYILPFFSSAFVPTASMTPVVAFIAENQPFTPIIDTLRALLMGEPTGNRALIALAWCIGIGLLGYVWSRRAYNRSMNS